MKPNRYLGVSCEAPTDDDGTLTRFAFPGGYEIVYVFGDGEEICAKCANAYLVERIERYAYEADTSPMDALSGMMYARSEILTGYFAMDSQDSCVRCEECGTTIAASGCEDVCGYVNQTASGNRACALAFHWDRHLGANVCARGHIASVPAPIHPAIVSEASTYAPTLRHGEYCSYGSEEA